MTEKATQEYLYRFESREITTEFGPKMEVYLRRFPIQHRATHGVRIGSGALTRFEDFRSPVRYAYESPDEAEWAFRELQKKLIDFHRSSLAKAEAALYLCKNGTLWEPHD